MSQLPQVGFIMTEGTLAYGLQYARENLLPDGTRQIVLATNRPLTSGVGAAVTGGTKNRYDLGVTEQDAIKAGYRRRLFFGGVVRPAGAKARCLSACA